MKKNRKMRKAFLMGAGILALTSTTFAYYGGGQGMGRGQGGGCHGDQACMEARMKENGIDPTTAQNFRNQRIKNQNNNFRGNGHGLENINRQNFNDEFQKHDCQQKLDEIKSGQKYDLSQKEKEYISHMREEEKIARDVYTTLYNKWGIRTFGNIKGSEQRHMDMVKILIDKYGLKDSMSDNTVGKFDSQEFQKLYNDLVAKGLKSEKDALEVGMTIEDLDISDLDKYLAETKNPDVKEVFTRLNNGSYNHMKAFKRQLDRIGGDYKPQFISQERYQEVLKSEHTHGNNNQNLDGQNRVNNNFKGRGMRQGYGRMQFQNQIQTQPVEEKGFFQKIWDFLFGWL